MATRGRPPRGGRSERTYTFDRCKAGTKESGWLAGPIHWIECHEGGLTKPCEKVLLGNDARCPGCDSGLSIEGKGYVPLRRHDGRPFCVLIGKGAYDVVNRIAPGSRVFWGRREGIGENVFVLPRLAGEEWSYYWPDVRPDDDMSAWLVRLWTLPHLLPALRAWLAVECHPADTPAPAAGGGAPADDIPPALLRAQMEQRAQWARMQVENAAALGGLIDRTLPSSKGTHKPE